MAHRAERELDEMLPAKTRIEAELAAEHYVDYLRTYAQPHHKIVLQNQA